MKKKIRVGILLQDYALPSWEYRMLEQVFNSSFVEVVLVVKNEATYPERKLLQRIRESYKFIFFVLYNKFENKFFKPSPDAFASKSIEGLLENIDEIKAIPKSGKFSDWLKKEDIEKIKTYEVDVFLRMGFRILRGAILKVPKYGIWSYHHGDNKVNRGGPAGIWETLENWDETGAILQIINEDLDGGYVLHKSITATNKQSFVRNRNSYYWKSSSFLPRTLKELYDLGGEAFMQKIEADNRDIQFYNNRLYTVPTNSEVAKAFFSKIIRSISAKIKAIFYFDQWILLFKLGKKPTLARSFFRFNKIVPPQDRFWADPHIIKKNGKYYIFLEEFVFSKGKGHISVMEMDESGTYTKPEKVLETDFHLSYPFILEEGEDIFMIPETGANRTIEIYRCIDFPHKWVLEKRLFENVFAVDTTVFKKGGKFWLFTSMINHEGIKSFDELSLFYSDDLLSTNWTPHPQNPIVSSVKKSRSAGPIFSYKGDLYRPGQDCAKLYGHGMTIAKITKINELEYKEEDVDAIYPKWDKKLIATHSYVNNDKLTVIDGLQTTRFSIQGWGMRIARVFGRFFSF